MTVKIYLISFPAEVKKHFAVKQYPIDELVKIRLERHALSVLRSRVRERHEHGITYPPLPLRSLIVAAAAPPAIFAIRISAVLASHDGSAAYLAGYKFGFTFHDLSSG